MIDMPTISDCLLFDTEPALVEAIVQVESGFNELAFNVNKWSGMDYNSPDHDANVAAVKVFVESGYSVDIGLMQINSENLEKYNVVIDDGFDVCTNVQLGEKILLDGISLAEDKGLTGVDAVKAGLSMYNTGNITSGFNNGYVDRVWKNYKGVYSDASNASVISPDKSSREANTVVELSGNDLFDFSRETDIGIEQK